MIILLIIIYIAAANGLVVPTGCFVAAWILASLKIIAEVITGLAKIEK